MKLVRAAFATVAWKATRSDPFLLRPKPAPSPTAFRRAATGRRGPAVRPLFSDAAEDAPAETETFSPEEDREGVLDVAPISNSRPIVRSEAAPRPDPLPRGCAWKTGSFSQSPSLVTFDLATTFLKRSSSPGMVLREVLLEAAEFNVRLPRPDVFDAAYERAFREMEEAHPCYGCGTGMTAREWHRRLAHRAYADAEGIDDELRAEMEDYLFDEVFDALYEDASVGLESWDLRPGGLDALTRFMEWRDKFDGPKLAILCNMDERVHKILSNLDISEAFDFVMCSREIGASKPDRRMFEVAMSRVGETDPKNCVHVGADFEKDVMGAAEAGWHGIYVNEFGELQVPSAADDAENGLDFSILNDLFGVLRIYGKDSDDRAIITTRPVLENGRHGFEQHFWSDEDEEDEDDDDTPEPMYSLPATDRKSWEGPGRF